MKDLHCQRLALALAQAASQAQAKDALYTIGALEGKLRFAKRQNARMHKDNTRLQGRVRDLEKVRDTRFKQVTDAKDEIMRKSKALISANEQAARLREELENERERSDRLGSMHLRQTAANNKVVDENARLKDELTRKNRIIDVLLAEVEQLDD